MKFPFHSFLLSALLVLISPKDLRASHLMGAYVSYLDQTGGSYEFQVHLITDCWASGLPTTDICINSASLNMSIPLTLSYGTTILHPFHPCMAGSLNYCAGGTLMQMAENIYIGTTYLPAAADWKIVVLSCCRAPVPSTMDMTLTDLNAQVSIYTLAKLDNLNFPSNSSPQFSNYMSQNFCLGTFTQYDYSCYDPDGDSLVYFLDSTYWAGCSDTTAPLPVNYVSPYTYLEFIHSSTPIVMNSSTGILSFTPAEIQSSIYSIRVDEYRNGIKIGSVKRQDQLLVTPFAPGAVGINSIETDNPFLISPNPSAGIFNLKFNVGDERKLVVYNLSGKIIYTECITGKEESSKVDLSYLADGIYSLHISSTKNYFAKKIVVNH